MRKFYVRAMFAAMLLSGIIVLASDAALARAIEFGPIESIQYYEQSLNPREIAVGIAAFCEFGLSAEMMRTMPRKALADQVVYLVERYHVPEAVAEEMTALAFQDYATGRLNVEECRSAVMMDDGAPLY